MTYCAMALRLTAAQKLALASVANQNVSTARPALKNIKSRGIARNPNILYQAASSTSYAQCESIQGRVEYWEKSPL